MHKHPQIDMEATNLNKLVKLKKQKKKRYLRNLPAKNYFLKKKKKIKNYYLYLYSCYFDPAFRDADNFL